MQPVVSRWPLGATFYYFLTRTVALWLGLSDMLASAIFFSKNIFEKKLTQYILIYIDCTVYNYLLLYLSAVRHNIFKYFYLNNILY